LSSYFSGVKLKNEDNLNLSDIGNFIKPENDVSNLIFSSIIIGFLSKEKNIYSYLNSVKNIMSPNNFNNLLIILDDELNIDTSREIIWLLQNKSEKYIVDEVSKKYSQQLSVSSELELNEKEVRNNINDINLLNAVYYKNEVLAIDSFCRLSITGNSNKKQLVELIALFDSKLMLKQQFSVLENLIKFDLRCFNKLPAVLMNSCCYLNEDIDLDKYFINSCILVSLKPEMYDPVVRQMEELDKYNSTNYSKIINDLFVLCYEYRVNYVNYLIEIGNFNKAEKLLYAISISNAEDDIKILIAYSKLNALRGDFSLSLQSLSHYLNRKYSFPVAKELLRILNITGNFLKSEQVIQQMIDNGDDVAPALKMPILQAQGRIGEAYSKYMEFPSRLNLNRYIPDKVLKFIPDQHQKLFALSAYGPGDEIRFCTIYNEIHSYFDDVIFTCDYRLENLIRRSFPEIRIISTKRIRSVSRFTGLKEHNLLPDKNLSSLMDNNLYLTLAEEEDRKVMFIPEMISMFRKTKENFRSGRIFTVDKTLATKFRQFLPEDTFLIGINWRSSLSGASRSQHYLEVSQLSKLFNLDNVKFVNLQYDDCDEELEYIRQNFGCDIINFNQIDQYNDLDSVAALMSCLNLVIAPCTSVVELAGAVGVNTLFFSNSEEVTWRKNDDGKDIWFDSISHISPKKIGDKNSLVDNIFSEISNLLNNSNRKIMN
jgi:capsular polysaccharide export protein